MHIVSYQPWGLLNRFRRDLDDLYVAGAEASPSWAPSVDVREEADRYTLQADLPGVDAKDIHVTADDGVLTLRGERRTAAPVGAGSAWSERRAGSFERRFTLPDNVAAEQIRARHTNGVLEIVIPKQAAPEPRRIAVEVN
jgi:HSP20 family protein